MDKHKVQRITRQFRREGYTTRSEIEDALSAGDPHGYDVPILVDEFDGSSRQFRFIKYLVHEGLLEPWDSTGEVEPHEMTKELQKANDLDDAMDRMEDLGVGEFFITLTTQAEDYLASL